MIKAIILDDEEKGTSLLNHKLANFSDKLEVVAIFNEPEKALTIIKNLDIDVLFLDIEMPKINGFQFLGENPNAGWSDIVHQFDYFDQNHFIREFKQFTGAVPKDRRKWEALFNPLKKAIEEGFETDAEQMKRYRNASLYQILHYISPEH